MCARPLCKEGCPLKNDIPSVIKFIRSGEYEKAVGVIGHPFGEICGYVCPCEIQCEGACVLGVKNNSVATGMIERELFARFPYVIERKGSVLSGKKFAVIGGGVSGLTFAAKVYERGADVTIFERDELLSTVKLIPSMRLPTDAVMRAEKAFSDKFGIVYKQINAAELKRLKSRFDGVYVSVGLNIDYGLGINGQELAVNYRDCLKGNYAKGTVVVIGGGNSAIDCARFAKSQGCRAIVAYRRTEQDMPAFAAEIASAKKENVEFTFNAAPVDLRQEGEKLRLTLAKTVSEGRGKLLVTDEHFAVECNSVIAAVGSKFDTGILEKEKNNDRYLQYDNVYLGGDAKCGKLVVHAVADAMNVAYMIISDARKKCL